MGSAYPQPLCGQQTVKGPVSNVYDCDKPDSAGKMHESCGALSACGVGTTCDIDGTRPNWVTCTSSRGTAGCVYEYQWWNACITDDSGQKCCYALPPAERAAAAAAAALADS